MYTLHIANKNYSSWSLRPWVLMRTLGIAFAEQIHPFDGLPGASTYGSFSPNGRVPCLDVAGAQVWDSLAIVEYLAEHHAGVWPRDSDARRWARCAAAEMHSSFASLRNACSMSCGVRVRMNTPSAGLKADLDRISALWAEGLQRYGGPFLAGNAFTAVDAFFAPVTFRALTYGLDFGPAGNAYAEMIRDLPAMRDWYVAALDEPWREQGHEDEIQAAGEIIEDMRAGA